MKHKKKINIKRISILCISILFLLGVYQYPFSSPNLQNPTKQTEELNTIESKYAILVDVENHQTLFSKNSQDKISPASLTKIMSTIIAIEYYDDYHLPLRITENSLQQLALQNSSLAGFVADEKVSIEDLLYATLLSSGGEATMTLANNIAGNEKNFVAMMNQKAQELKMHNTHFTNACGFDDTNHYSTVFDIATLLEYCLQNETFRKIFTTFEHSTSSTNIHPHGITLTSTFASSLDDFSIHNSYIIGAKTGYTDNAGLCLASLGKVNAHEYIFVSGKATGNHYTKPYHILDAIMAYQSIQ